MRATRTVLLLLAVTAPTISMADGGFFPVYGGTGNSADQRAVIIRDGARETLVLQTARDGEVGDFAWIIPTPSLVTRADVSEGDPRLFDELYYLTEPRAIAKTRGGGGGFGCSGGSSPANDTAYGGVSLWDEFAVSDYSVAVLSADDSANLGRWLDDNGYAMPDGAGDILDYYIARQWYFVAVKVRPEPGPAAAGASPDPVPTSLKPLQISFTTPETVFPMRISAVSSRREVSVLLYVFAPHRVISENYPTVQVQAGSDWSGVSFASYYQRKFRDALDQAGPGGIVTEYAAPVDAWWISSSRDLLPLDTGQVWFLTRLRTILAPEDMVDDIILVQARSDDRFTVDIVASAPRAHPLRLAGASLLLIGLVMYQRRRGDMHWLRSLLAVALIASVAL